jgi:hypothetical protein
VNNPGNEGSGETYFDSRLERLEGTRAMLFGTIKQSILNCALTVADLEVRNSLRLDRSE